MKPAQYLQEKEETALHPNEIWNLCIMRYYTVSFLANELPSEKKSRILEKRIGYFWVTQKVLLLGDTTFVISQKRLLPDPDGYRLLMMAKIDGYGAAPTS